MIENKEKKHCGRPTKSPSMKRDKIVQAKLTKMEYNLIQKRAEKAGITLYNYVRESVLDSRPTLPITKDGWDIIKELISCANNLNRKVNDFSTVEVVDAVNYLNKATEKLLKIISQ